VSTTILVNCLDFVIIAKAEGKSEEEKEFLLTI